MRFPRGPWRVAVIEGSMRPTIEPGDWLLIDPTVRRWPRRGAVVVFREPESDVLAIKRVAAGPGDVVRGVRVTDPATGDEVEVTIRLIPDEAWLLGDDPAASVDSRRYGPVALDRLVGRAWFRYAPMRRLGRLRRAGGSAPPS
jgi:signal peptidase I